MFKALLRSLRVRRSSPAATVATTAPASPQPRAWKPTARPVRDHPEAPADPCPAESIGFSTEFLALHDGCYICLARKAEEPVAWTPLDNRERVHRVAAYRKAWDTSVVRMPEHARWHVADEWDEVVRRALAAGIARVPKQGEVRPVGKLG